MATFYHWLDAGGPGRNLTGTVIDRLRQILIPCLVDGYGDRAGAGWTLIHNEPSGFSFQNASGSGAVNFTRSGWSVATAENMQIRLVETPTGFSGGILTGENVRSGAGAPSSSPHEFSAYYPLSGALASSGWVVLADENTFIFAMTNNLDPAGQDRAVALYIGEDVEGHFIALGGENDTGYGAEGYAFCRGYTVLRDPSTGLVISGAGSVAGADPFLRQSAGLRPERPMPLSGSLLLSPVRWSYGSQLIAQLKGILIDPYFIEASVGTALLTLGLAKTLGDFGRPVQVGGMTLAAASGWTARTGPFYLTDSAEFW